jgi:uncharacterized damage-inducible protein DinB
MTTEEIDRIRDQLRRAHDGEAWPGSSVMALLETVTPAQAAARPLPGAHSIWEILLHMTSTCELVRRRLEGDATELTSEEDWPEVEDESERAWTDAVTSFAERHRAVLDASSRLEDAELDEPILPGYSSVYVTLHGLVQHATYHAGQIGILTKA